MGRFLFFVFFWIHPCEDFALVFFRGGTKLCHVTHKTSLLWDIHTGTNTFHSKDMSRDAKRIS